MTDEKRDVEPTEPTEEELAPQDVAVPANAAVAANVLSDSSVARAKADQDVAIDEGN